MNGIQKGLGWSKGLVALVVLAGVLLLAGLPTWAAAGEHGGHGGPGGPSGPRGGWDNHYRPAPDHRGGVSIRFGGAPTPYYYYAPAPVYVVPTQAPVVIAPDPQIMTLSDGTIIQRTYSVYGSSVVYSDTVLRPAPMIVRPAPVIIHPAPVPTWVNVVRGLGIGVRW